MGNSVCCTGSEETSTFDQLVKRTILIVTDDDANDHMEASLSMIQLIQRLNTDEEAFWQLGESMIRLAPADEIYTVNIISLLIQQCCLPSPSLLVSCGERFNLASLIEAHSTNKRSIVNVCLLLGCLAYRYAGQRSVLLLQDDVFNFLLHCLQLNVNENSTIILASMYALERFCITRENRLKVESEFSKFEKKNPLFCLERYYKEARNFKQHKIGFVATWMLDNVFEFNNYVPSYKRTTTENLQVNLNLGSIANALMLSPTGLEVRSNVVPFETVRSSMSVSEGAWYYEVTIITDGVLQIGWMSNSSDIDPDPSQGTVKVLVQSTPPTFGVRNFIWTQGSGVGDDVMSVGFDGCRQYIWHKGEHTKHRLRWKSGDIVGALLDFKSRYVQFSLNGRCLPPFREIFLHIENEEMVAAASLMTFQQCVFNFGRTPFKYPPWQTFKAMNEFGHLSNEQRLVLPRSYYRAKDVERTSESVYNACCICVSREANAQLIPCGHEGICKSCAKQLNNCPFCRMYTLSIATLKRRNSRLSTNSNSDAPAGVAYSGSFNRNSRVPTLPEDLDHKSVEVSTPECFTAI